MSSAGSCAGFLPFEFLDLRRFRFSHCPTGRSTGVNTPDVGGGGALGGGTPDTTGPSGGASAAAHSFPPNATPLPSRIADLVQDYIPTPQVLRDRDHGIKFLKPSKTGKNKDKFHRYSAATTTRQYFDLGDSAADWRYDLKHKYATFTDPDLHRRAGELLSLRVLSEGALLSVFSAGGNVTLQPVRRHTFLRSSSIAFCSASATTGPTS